MQYRPAIFEIKSTHHLLERDLAALLLACDWAQLRECMQRLLALLGVGDFMLRMDITSPNGAGQCHLFGTLPPLTLDLFNAIASAETDPIDHHNAKSGLPLAWHIDKLCISNTAQVYLQLKAHGIHHGMSMPIRCGQALSRVDFYGHMPETFPFSTAISADLLLLGSYLHEATRLLREKETADQRPLLTTREIECLHWSAIGKTSLETGLILGISPHTVYFHLKKVASKLKVYGTRHAVNRAIAIGLI